MKLIPNISKEAKQTLMGGVVASLAVNLESGLSYFVAGYPQFLKDKIVPQLPRNGALIANLAPAGASVYIKKKGHPSAKTDNMTTGMLLYDLPKLMQQIVYNVAYQAGLPTAGVGMRLSQMNLRIVPRQAMTSVPTFNGINNMSKPQAFTSSGKYGKSAVPAKAMASGMGKYR